MVEEALVFVLKKKKDGQGDLTPGDSRYRCQFELLISYHHRRTSQLGWLKAYLFVVIAFVMGVVATRAMF
jgi:hypothetical protein